jgi:hypothetical protein
LTWIDEALALAGETGEHWSDAFLHRVCGEILLKRDPGNTAPAEDAFPHCNRHLQQQKEPSFELARGSLAGEALSLNGPPCRARVCAQGLFADPGISRDRGSASASQRADVMSESQKQSTKRLTKHRP